MKMTCRLFAITCLILFLTACSAGTKSNIAKSQISPQERQKGKYYLFFEYSSLYPSDVQDQLYRNLMELMGKADALADSDLTVEYVAVVRVRQYKTVSEYSRVLYGYLAGEDILQTEVAVVKFDALKTAKFRSLSGQSTSSGAVEPNSNEDMVSRAAQAIFKMHGDHLLKSDLRTHYRKPTAISPGELIGMHAEEVTQFILGK